MLLHHFQFHPPLTDSLMNHSLYLPLPPMGLGMKSDDLALSSSSESGMRMSTPFLFTTLRAGGFFFFFSSSFSFFFLSSSLPFDLPPPPKLQPPFFLAFMFASASFSSPSSSSAAASVCSAPKPRRVENASSSSSPSPAVYNHINWMKTLSASHLFLFFMILFIFFLESNNRT